MAQKFQANGTNSYYYNFKKTKICYKRATIWPKNYLKKIKLKNPKLFLKTDIFKSHNRLRITTKSNDLQFNTSGSQLDWLLIKLSHELTKNNKFKKKPKFQTILQHDTV